MDSTNKWYNIHLRPGLDLWSIDDGCDRALIVTRHIDDKKMKKDMIETHFLLMFLNDLGVVSYEQFYEDVYEIRIPIA